MIKSLTFVLATLLMMCTIIISAQETFEVEVDAIGSDRIMAKFHNINNSSQSSARLSIYSGTVANQGSTEITSFANSYVASPGYAGYGTISNNSTGILLRSYTSTGNIRFLTGGGSIATNTRMFINPVGQVGFGTAAPAKKIHLKEGDLYLDTATGSEVIMKSPDGTCFSVTVTNIKRTRGTTRNL